jgi:hypothetical protein
MGDEKDRNRGRLRLPVPSSNRFYCNLCTKDDESDGMRLVTEIPMAFGMSFLCIFGLLLVLRIVISFFELIRLFKKDNLILYGLGVTVVYGFIGMVMLGSAMR